MWESTDGGLTFGAGVRGPDQPDSRNGLDYTDTCNVAVDLDDVVPFNYLGAQYDRSQGTSTLSANRIDFEMSSWDPFATWSFDFTGGGATCPARSRSPRSDPRAMVRPGQRWGASSASAPTRPPSAGPAEAPSRASSRRARRRGPGIRGRVTARAIKFFRWSTPTGPCGSDPGEEPRSRWRGQLASGRLRRPTASTRDWPAARRGCGCCRVTMPPRAVCLRP